jgi:hypothetical protein
MGKGADEEKWTRAVSRWFTCCLGAATEKMRLGLVGFFAAVVSSSTSLQLFFQELWVPRQL